MSWLPIPFCGQWLRQGRVGHDIEMQVSISTLTISSKREWQFGDNFQWRSQFFIVTSSVGFFFFATMTS